MAKHYIGIDAGKGPKDIVIGTSSTDLGIEIVINDAKVTSKAQAYALLEHLKGRIVVGEWKPKAT
jgi:hypothetical protein